jgi:hypothetical protein
MFVPVANDTVHLAPRQTGQPPLADNIQLPFRWTVASPGSRFIIQVDELEQNVPVDDAKFAAPPRPPS